MAVVVVVAGPCFAENMTVSAAAAAAVAAKAQALPPVAGPSESGPQQHDSLTIGPTLLFPKNRNVDEINTRRLAELKTPMYRSGNRAECDAVCYCNRM